MPLMLMSTVDLPHDRSQADVCIINGAPIKGNREYPDKKVSYIELQEVCLKG